MEENDSNLASHLIENAYRTGYLDALASMRMECADIMESEYSKPVTLRRDMVATLGLIVDVINKKIKGLTQA